MPANKEDVNAGDIIIKLFTTGWERGKVEDIKKGSPSQKREAKDFTVPRLVRYVLDSSYWLHDLGDEDAVYLTEEQRIWRTAVLRLMRVYQSVLGALFVMFLLNLMRLTMILMMKKMMMNDLHLDL